MACLSGSKMNKRPFDIVGYFVSKGLFTIYKIYVVHAGRQS